MEQIAFHICLYVAGLAFLFPALGQVGAVYWALAAFPFGVLMWVLGAAVLVATGLPMSLWTTGLLVTVIGCLRMLALRSGPRGQAWRLIMTAALGVAALLIVAMLVRRFDYTMLSSDGFIVTYLGRSLAEHQGFKPMLSGILPEWGMFTVLIQGTSFWLGTDYLTLTQPLLSVSLACLVAHAIAEEIGPGRRAWSFGIVASACMASGLFYGFNTFFIHNALPTALYLFMAFMAFRKERGDGAWSALGWWASCGVIISRPEGPVLAAVAILCCFGARNASLRNERKPAIMVSALTLVWYVQLSQWSDQSSKIMSPMKAALIVAPMVGVALIPWVKGRFGWTLVWTPRLILVAVAVGLVVAFNLVPETMQKSAEWYGLNFFYTGRWGTLSAVLVGSLGVAVLVGGRIKEEEAFVCLLTTIPLFILLMASMRLPYRHGWGDSANRMLFHILPLLTSYLALKLGPSSLRVQAKPQ